MAHVVEISGITICVTRLVKLDLFKFTWRMGQTSIGVKYLRKFEDINDVHFELVVSGPIVTFRAWSEECGAENIFISQLGEIKFLSTVRENMIIGAEDEYSYTNVGISHVLWYLFNGGKYIRIGSIMRPVYLYKNTYYMVNGNGMIEECVTCDIPDDIAPEFNNTRLLFEIDDPSCLSTASDEKIVDITLGPFGSIISNGNVFYLEFYNYESRLIDRTGNVITLINVN